MLVFDLGGGTLDVSLLEITYTEDEDPGAFVEVKATAGDNHLGGDDWDQRITQHLVASFYDQHRVDLSRDRPALQRLSEAAEQAKIELSSAHTTTIDVPYVANSPGGALHLTMDLTRVGFQAMTEDLLERCKAPLHEVFAGQHFRVDGQHFRAITISDLDHVVLVGGASRMPAIADLVRECTGGKEPRREVIPEGVVVGATLQAAIMSGEIRDALLLDALPFSLGLETVGGVMSRMVDRNTTIPHRHTENFTTTEDGQPSVQVRVYQGDHDIAAYNTLLAVFDLDGIPPAPRGEPLIEIDFDVDSNTRVIVRARNPDTGARRELTMTRHTAAAAAKHPPVPGHTLGRVPIPSPTVPPLPPPPN